MSPIRDFFYNIVVNSIQIFIISPIIATITLLMPFYFSKIEFVSLMYSTKAVEFLFFESVQVLLIKKQKNITLSL